MVLSIWAVPDPFSGCFVMTKSVRQHKIGKGRKLQKSESSFIRLVIAEGSTNALPVFTSILVLFFFVQGNFNGYRMSLTRHRRRTFLLCKETGMQKWARMLVNTGKAFVVVGLSAMTTQIIEDSDFWSLPPLTILCWRTLLVITKHPEDGPGIAQMDNTSARLITFW